MSLTEYISGILVRQPLNKFEYAYHIQDQPETNTDHIVRRRRQVIGLNYSNKKVNSRNKKQPTGCHAWVVKCLAFYVE